jgi:hypothetical protein
MLPVQPTVTLAVRSASQAPGENGDGATREQQGDAAATGGCQHAGHLGTACCCTRCGEQAVWRTSCLWTWPSAESDVEVITVVEALQRISRCASWNHLSENMDESA